MIILIKGPESRTIQLTLPTKLVFHPGILRIGMKIANNHAGNHIPSISSGAIYALCKNIYSIKGQYKHWELVNIETAEGRIIQIIL